MQPTLEPSKPDALILINKNWAPALGLLAPYRICYERAVAQSLNTMQASNPQISFTVFKQGRYPFVDPRICSVRGHAVRVQSNESS